MRSTGRRRRQAPSALESRIARRSFRLPSCSGAASLVARQRLVPALDFIVPPIPPEPPVPPIPPIPPFPPVLRRTRCRPASFPIIGPELATYGVVQPLARQLGLSILGTLDDRVGDTYEPDGCAGAPAPGRADLCGRPADQEAGRRADQEAWACALSAVFALGLGPLLRPNDPQPLQAFADPRADGNLGGFQGGIDLLARIPDRRQATTAPASMAPMAT